jgi:hypothetical protein
VPPILDGGAAARGGHKDVVQRLARCSAAKARTLAAAMARAWSSRPMWCVSAPQQPWPWGSRPRRPCG